VTYRDSWIPLSMTWRSYMKVGPSGVVDAVDLEALDADSLTVITRAAGPDTSLLFSLTRASHCV